MGIVSDIANGIAGMFSTHDYITCACCKKCFKESETFIGKRVFRCQHGYGVTDIGIPVLATKTEDIKRCYPPCRMCEGAYEPLYPENPTEYNHEFDDWECDWDPNEQRIDNDHSLDPDDYYQKF